MTLTVRLRRSILPAAVFAAALFCSIPAGASQPAPVPTHIVATPASAPAAGTAQAASRQAAQEMRASTRGVNIAIVALGALWILLMIRRVQSVVALRHAEAGH